MVSTDTTLEGAPQVAARIRQALREIEFAPRGQAVTVTASFGVAEALEVLSSTADVRKSVLIGAADDARCRAKQERPCRPTGLSPKWAIAREPCAPNDAILQFRLASRAYEEWMMISITRAATALLLMITAGAVATACVGSDPGGSSPVDGSGATTDASTSQPDGPNVVPGMPGTDGGKDTGPTNEAGQPWSPADIKGLALWLDGDTAKENVNGTVDTWSDKSSFKNDARTTTDAQKPLLLKGSASVNGHQALRFDGVNTFFTLTDSASLQWPGSFVIVAVFRHAAAPGNEFGTIYAKLTAGGADHLSAKGPSLYLATQNPVAFAECEIGYPAFLDTDRKTGFAPGTHRVRAAWDSVSTTLSVQIDKKPPVSAVESNVTGLDATGHDAMIGNSIDNSRLTGDLAEVVAIAGATVDPNDVTMLQAYLDTKYGL